MRADLIFWSWKWAPPLSGVPKPAIPWLHLDAALQVGYDPKKCLEQVWQQSQEWEPAERQRAPWGASLQTCLPQIRRESREAVAATTCPSVRLPQSHVHRKDDTARSMFPPSRQPCRWGTRQRIALSTGPSSQTHKMLCGVCQQGSSVCSCSRRCRLPGSPWQRRCLPG